MNAERELCIHYFYVHTYGCLYRLIRLQVRYAVRRYSRVIDKKGAKKGLNEKKSNTQNISGPHFWRQLLLHNTATGIIIFFLK